MYRFISIGTKKASYEVWVAGPQDPFREDPDFDGRESQQKRFETSQSVWCVLCEKERQPHIHKHFVKQELVHGIDRVKKGAPVFRCNTLLYFSWLFIAVQGSIRSTSSRKPQFKPTQLFAGIVLNLPVCLSPILREFGSFQDPVLRRLELEGSLWVKPSTNPKALGQVFEVLLRKIGLCCSDQFLQRYLFLFAFFAVDFLVDCNCLGVRTKFWCFEAGRLALRL